MEKGIKRLVGAKVLKIRMDEDHLQFTTDRGDIAFNVYSDCCSQSVFYDFLGVRNLLENGPIITAESIDLKPDLGSDSKKYQEDIQVYGYRLTTEHPVFGPVSSVFSFRNYSNGYYGGELIESAPLEQSSSTPEITRDIIETVPSGNHG